MLGMRPFGGWRGSLYALYIKCVFRILNNFSYIDNKFIIEDFITRQWALYLERGRLVPGVRLFMPCTLIVCSEL